MIKPVDGMDTNYILEEQEKVSSDHILSNNVSVETVDFLKQA